MNAKMRSTPYDTGTNKMPLQIFHCLRCGYEWVGRRGRPAPKTCANPKCRSPYWDRERIRPR